MPGKQVSNICKLHDSSPYIGCVITVFSSPSQRLLKLTQPNDEWLPAPEKRRRAKQAATGAKMTPITSDFSSSLHPPPYNNVTESDVNGKQAGDFDNPAYMTENSDSGTQF